VYSVSGDLTLDMGHGGTRTIPEPELQLFAWCRLLHPCVWRHVIIVVQKAGQLVWYVPDTGRTSQLSQLSFCRHRQQDRQRNQRGYAVVFI